MSARYFKKPLRLLLLEMRSAARNITTPEARAKAAREARLIPLSLFERIGGAPSGSKADLSKRARAVMKSLPDLADEDLPAARGALLALIELLEAPSHSGPLTQRKEQVRA